MFFKLHDYTLGANKNVSSKTNYRNYIFNSPKTSIHDSSEVSISMDSKAIKDSSGNYISHKYKTRFTMDVGRMSIGFGLNEYDNAHGMAQFLFSDILGDHKIYLGTETNIDFIRSDYSFAYRYLPQKIDWTFVFLHNGMSSYPQSYYDDSNVLRYATKKKNKEIPDEMPQMFTNLSLLEILKLKEFSNLDIQEKYTDNIIKYTNIM